MSEGTTTVCVQRYLDALAGEGDPDPIVRDLLERAAGRLQALSASMLRRQYPRLMRPPLNARPDELLGPLVERLLKAMRKVKPRTVREFFALANQHMRWELNELARNLDNQPRTATLTAAGEVAARTDVRPDSGVSIEMGRVLAAIECLPEEERETFSLVRIQGLSHAEAGEVLGVSSKTIQRRMNVALQSLLDDLRGRQGDHASGSDG